MAVLHYIDWENGSYASGEYTSATPDIPNAFVYTGDASIASSGGAPWNGQYLANVATNSYSAFAATLTSGEMQTTSGRILIESTPHTYEGGAFVSFRTSAVQHRLNIERINGTPDYLQVAAMRDYSSWTGVIDFASFPSNPFAIEIIYDYNNATGADRLKARVWDIGGAPGSFTTCSSSGNGGTTTQWETIGLGNSGESTPGLSFGRIIISNDIAEDLSSYGESTQSNAPRVTRHLQNMMRG